MPNFDNMAIVPQYFSPFSNFMFRQIDVGVRGSGSQCYDQQEGRG